MSVSQTIETGANSALNVGLGVFKTVELAVQDIQASLGKTYSDLIARGAADNSEVAVNLRTGLDRGIAAVRDVQSKVEGALK
jgi:hypothetical protein